MHLHKSMFLVKGDENAEPPSVIQAAPFGFSFSGTGSLLPQRGIEAGSLLPQPEKKWKKLQEMRDTRSAVKGRGTTAQQPDDRDEGL